MILVDILTDGIFAAVAAIGFGAISDPPLRAFPSIALLAAIGHALRFCLMTYLGVDIATASLFASFSIGMGSLVLGKRIYCPMTSSFFTSTATTEGSRMTMPLPRIYTSVLAVPKSIPISRLKNIFSSSFPCGSNPGGARSPSPTNLPPRVPRWAAAGRSPDRTTVCERVPGSYRYFIYLAINPYIIYC